jgi:hypothetical protein
MTGPLLCLALGILLVGIALMFGARKGRHQ